MLPLKIKIKQDIDNSLCLHFLPRQQPAKLLRQGLVADDVVQLLRPADVEEKTLAYLGRVAEQHPLADRPEHHLAEAGDRKSVV